MQGDAAIRGAWDEEERVIAEEFLSHARAIRAERKEAEKEGRAPRIWNCFNRGGAPPLPTANGSSIAPRYTLNHEEVEKALEEGIWFAEGLTPVRVDTDKWEHAEAVQFAIQVLDETGSWQKTGTNRIAGPRRSGCGWHSAQHRTCQRRRKKFQAERPLFCGLR